MSNNPIYGKNAPPEGKYPSVLLINPKYSANVGAAVRAASCFGAKQVWWTGNRIQLDDNHRLPREERMRGYAEVELRQFEYPFEHYKGATPVAIELLPNTENLFDFDHPEEAVYVFGPEDGSIDQVYRRLCHRFVTIPTKHCTNLAAAVYIILYDRAYKNYLRTGEVPILNEHRGMFGTPDESEVWKQIGYKDGVAFV